MTIIVILQVVAILEKRNNRACTGNISLMTDKNPNWAFFKPVDSRMPRMRIPMSECPKGNYAILHCFYACNDIEIYN